MGVATETFCVPHAHGIPSQKRSMQKIPGKLLLLLQYHTTTPSPTATNSTTAATLPLFLLLKLVLLLLILVLLYHYNYYHSINLYQRKPVLPPAKSVQTRYPNNYGLQISRHHFRHCAVNTSSTHQIDQMQIRSA